MNYKACKDLLAKRYRPNLASWAKDKAGAPREKVSKRW